MEKGYYWIKHYNHSKNMIMYWNGFRFETFKSDEVPHDELDLESLHSVVDLPDKEVADLCDCVIPKPEDYISGNVYCKDCGGLVKNEQAKCPSCYTYHKHGQECYQCHNLPPAE